MSAALNVLMRLGFELKDPFCAQGIAQWIVRCDLFGSPFVMMSEDSFEIGYLLFMKGSQYLVLVMRSVLSIRSLWLKFPLLRHEGVCRTVRWSRSTTARHGTDAKFAVHATFVVSMATTSGTAIATSPESTTDRATIAADLVIGVGIALSRRRKL